MADMKGLKPARQPLCPLLLELCVGFREAAAGPIPRLRPKINLKLQSNHGFGSGWCVVEGRAPADFAAFVVERVVWGRPAGLLT